MYTFVYEFEFYRRVRSVSFWETRKSSEVIKKFLKYSPNLDWKKYKTSSTDVVVWLWAYFLTHIQNWIFSLINIASDQANKTHVFYYVFVWENTCVFHFPFKKHCAADNFEKAVNKLNIQYGVFWHLFRQKFQNAKIIAHFWRSNSY
jgi:hypothetical protein